MRGFLIYLLLGLLTILPLSSFAKMKATYVSKHGYIRFTCTLVDSNGLKHIASASANNPSEKSVKKAENIAKEGAIRSCKIMAKGTRCDGAVSCVRQN